jgi:hypothetical protein
LLVKATKADLEILKVVPTQLVAVEEPVLPEEMVTTLKAEALLVETVYQVQYLEQPLCTLAVAVADLGPEEI